MKGSFKKKLQVHGKDRDAKRELRLIRERGSTVLVKWQRESAAKSIWEEIY